MKLTKKWFSHVDSRASMRIWNMLQRLYASADETIDIATVEFAERVKRDIESGYLYPRKGALRLFHNFGLVSYRELCKAVGVTPLRPCRMPRTVRLQIPKDKLVLNRWYIGRGRNANVALWTKIGDRLTFLTIAPKFNQMVIKDEGYYHEDPQCGGCFQPFALVEEGTVVEPVGSKPGWDSHYAKTMRIP